MYIDIYPFEWYGIFSNGEEPTCTLIFKSLLWYKFSLVLRSWKKIRLLQNKLYVTLKRGSYVLGEPFPGGGNTERCSFCVCICLKTAPICTPRHKDVRIQGDLFNDNLQSALKTFRVKTIDRFHSRDQRPYWFNETKESICIKIELNSQRVSLVHQYGRHSFVLVHQHGRRNVI